MARVYLETSFISACVGDRSDAASVYRRGISLEWWKRHRVRYELFITAEVEFELSDPEFRHGAEAIRWIEEVPVLEIDQRVTGLAELLVKERVMPGPVAGDAIHVAAATVHGLEYMLSWNVRHLANPNKLAHLRVICLRAGLVPPQIVTPDFLWEPDHERR